MTKDELQVENGNFTRIINPLIDGLIKIPFKGCELAVAFYIIRKTYGFNKKQDEISLSQFEESLGRSRHTVIKALKNLQLVNIVTLVQRGSMKGDGNIWMINKYMDNWRVVNTVTLVQRRSKPSAIRTPNLVQTVPHTKDIKNNTKDSASDKSHEVEKIIDAFREVNPTSYRKWFANKTQRASALNLINIQGLDKTLEVIVILTKTNKQPYFPKISSPYELEEKWEKLKDTLISKKTESINKKPKIII